MYLHLEQGCSLGGLRFQKTASGQAGIQELITEQTKSSCWRESALCVCIHTYRHSLADLYTAQIGKGAG